MSSFRATNPPRLVLVPYSDAERPHPSPFARLHRKPGTRGMFSQGPRLVGWPPARAGSGPLANHQPARPCERLFGQCAGRQGSKRLGTQTQAPCAGRRRRAWPRARNPASIQDRDGGGPLMRVSRRIFPFIQRVFADSGYVGGEGHHGNVDRRRNRAQKSRSDRLRGKPAPLGCRTVLRLNWAQSEAGKGL